MAKYKGLTEYIDFFERYYQSREEYGNIDNIIEKFEAVILAYFVEEEDKFKDAASNQDNQFEYYKHFFNYDMLTRLLSDGINFDANSLEISDIENIFKLFRLINKMEMKVIYNNGALISILKRLKEIDDIYWPATFEVIYTGFMSIPHGYLIECLPQGTANIFQFNSRGRGMLDKSWRLCKVLNNEQTKELISNVQSLNDMDWNVIYEDRSVVDGGVTVIRMFGDNITTRWIWSYNTKAEIVGKFCKYIEEAADIENEEIYSFGLKRHNFYVLDPRYLNYYHVYFKDKKLNLTCNEIKKILVNVGLCYTKLVFDIKGTDSQTRINTDDDFLEKKYYYRIDYDKLEKISLDNNNLYDFIEYIRKVKKDVDNEDKLTVINNKRLLRDYLYNQVAYDYMESKGKELNENFDILEFEYYLFDLDMIAYLNNKDIEIILKELSSMITLEFPVDISSNRQHYANELFTILYPTKIFGMHGYFWRYMARKFTQDKLPISNDYLKEKYNTEVTRFNQNQENFDLCNRIFGNRDEQKLGSVFFNEGLNVLLNKYIEKKHKDENKNFVNPMSMTEQDWENLFKKANRKKR